VMAGHADVVAGAHGSRTHRAASSAAPPILKTGGPTGTRPLPREPMLPLQSRLRCEGRPGRVDRAVRRGGRGAGWRR